MALYLTNLIGLLALGVLWTGWILRYTDWFPVFGGLLGLGGLFAWIAFVSGLLQEARKKEMQALFENWILVRASTIFVLFLLAAMSLFIVAGRGTILLDSTVDVRTREFEIWDPATETVLHRGFATSGERKKLRVGTGILGTRTVRMELKGLPVEEIEVSALRRREVFVPKAFEGRPRLLVRMTPAMSETVANLDFEGEPRLEVSIDGGPVQEVAPFRGEAVWVGCAADVEVPQRILDNWSIELARVGGDTAAKLNRWARTSAAHMKRPLSEGETVSIAVYRGVSSDPIASAETTIRPSASLVSNVQECIVR